MASQPNAQAMAIPFTRGSTLATMKDATLSSLAAGSTTQVQLQTNAFLENVILDVSIVSGGTNSATVVWQKDAPFNVIAQIKLDDPAGQSIVAPITGFQLYTLNKYLLDTDCNFDPARDSGYYQLPTAASNSSSAAGAGVASFRLVVPIEHRRRDALGALNNSAANQRYLLTITTASSYAAGTDTANNLFSTAPTNTPTVSVSVYQQYWTAPPAVITTSSGSTQVQATPAGLGTVAFVRYERHNEVSGGGQPQIQLNNVGDYIANIIFTLRTTTGTNTRDVYTAGAPGTQTDYANWPAEFDWWENDFQVFALSQNDWVRWISRFYGLWNGVSAQAGNPGYLDAGVWPLYQLSALFDSANNFGPANQYLPTDATTKLQIRGSSWGSSSSYLEVVTRNVRPVSGAALFA
jgi:hypothetical protein